MAEKEKKNKKAVSKTFNKKSTNQKITKNKETNKKEIKEENVVLTDSVKEEKLKKEKKQTINQARKKLYYNDASGSDELSKLIKIVLIVTGIMVIFYGVTVVVTKKANEAALEANKQKAEIQYDSIMIGSMLNIDGSYYVLIEDENDVRASEYTNLLQIIKANDEAPTIYTANLGDSFNKNYLSNESNYDSNLENFKVKGTTLIKISDHKIKETYDNYDSIIKKLEELD